MIYRFVYVEFVFMENFLVVVVEVNTYNSLTYRADTYLFCGVFALGAFA